MDVCNRNVNSVPKFINNSCKENKGNHYGEGDWEMWMVLIMIKFGELLL